MGVTQRNNQVKNLSIFRQKPAIKFRKSPEKREFSNITQVQHETRHAHPSTGAEKVLRVRNENTSDKNRKRAFLLRISAHIC